MVTTKNNNIVSRHLAGKCSKIRIVLDGRIGGNDRYCVLCLPRTSDLGCTQKRRNNLPTKFGPPHLHAALNITCAYQSTFAFSMIKILT
jgi:hypothetical protein